MTCEGHIWQYDDMQEEEDRMVVTIRCDNCGSSLECYGELSTIRGEDDE